MQVLIDFLTLTSKIHSVEDILTLFGLDASKMLPGRPAYGYHSAYYLEGVQVMFDGREDVYINLSGKGCRFIETLNDGRWDWFSLFQALESDLLSKDVHISRLDVACDDFQGLLKYHTIVRYVQKRKYICKSKKMPYWSDGSEQSIYFGSPQSDRRLRIYNKALEQGKEEGFHWMRCEFQLRNQSALSFVLNWLRIRSIGHCYSGVLMDYLRFISKPVEDCNYCRAKVVDWWLKFTRGMSKIPQCYLPGNEYSFSSAFDFLSRQAGSTLKLLLEYSNRDVSFILDIADNSLLNQKQLNLLKRLQALDG